MGNKVTAPPIQSKIKEKAKTNVNIVSYDLPSASKRIKSRAAAAADLQHPPKDTPPATVHTPGLPGSRTA